ncbi:beta-N-acetylhexosaminidase [Pararhodonellum marinum]|uniref:beta-N-acetylhexosaminidase n=1 Tax=Pararhodonellum marinum TaxID=2755358 RepID=UPI001E4A8904|nr:beta-N-acetylhexosaminidase [Pararhodonellum marinum]
MIEKTFNIPKHVLTAILITMTFACSQPQVTDLDEVSLIPKPRSLDVYPGYFQFEESSQILVSDETLKPVAEYMAAFLRPVFGFGFSIANGVDHGGSSNIRLRLDNIGEELGDEGYILDIDEDHVDLIANSPAGVFWAVQTLRQLLPAAIESGKLVSGEKWAIGSGTIKDAPEYGYRGVMLDVARHYFGKEYVKRLIDLIALYKINHLHLHLSDDQGWRIEIKSWPRLTEIGGSTQVGGGEGGFYTQEDYQEIVAYAQDRFITIVPEIDMPGHTNSALASYGILNPGITVPEKGGFKVDLEKHGIPENEPQPTDLYTGIEVGFSTLDTDNPITYQFVEDVIREIAAITPGPYFHIGGDESHVTAMEDYIPFIEKAQELVYQYGKTAIGWDEIAHASLKPQSVVQYWAVAENAKMAVDQGAKVLISPAKRVYLDMQYDSTTQLGLHWAAYIEVDSSYIWEPTTLVPGIGREHIIGVESPLWTETITTMEEIEYMVFPRLAGHAEIGWTAPNSRNWDEYRVRLAEHGPRFEALGINFYRSPQIDWK